MNAGVTVVAAVVWQRQASGWAAGAARAKAGSSAQAASTGPDTSHLSEYKQRKTENYDAPADLKSGLLDIRIAATWSKDGHVVVRQDSPLPVSILAIIPEVSTGGS